MSNFAAPGEATGIDWNELNGSLLIVEPDEIVKDMNTVHGITDAVRATVNVIDGPKGGETYEDTLVFPRVLKAQLSKKLGQKVLGRLRQGQAKPGQSAPWKLEAGSEADQKMAIEWLARTQLTAADLDPSQAPF